MTANRICLLFDCYRGFQESRHPATLHDDLLYLRHRGLIETDLSRDGFGYKVTEKGRAVCDAIMVLAE